MKNMSLFSLLCMAGLLLACGGGDEGSIPSGTPDIPETPNEVKLSVLPSVLDAMALEDTYEIKVTNDKRGMDCSFYRWMDKPYSGKWGKQGRSN